MSRITIYISSYFGDKLFHYVMSHWQCLPNFRKSFEPHFLTSSLTLWMKWTRRPRPSPTR